MSCVQLSDGYVGIVSVAEGRTNLVPPYLGLAISVDDVELDGVEDQFHTLLLVC